MGLVERWVRALGVVVLCSACGGGDDDDDADDEVSGTVTEEWRDFCVATFTEDYQVIDFFDEPQFVAKKGEAYLLADFSDTFGPTASLIYLWPEGPEEFEITATTASDLPFTSSCPLNTGVPYYAVFEDTSVYAEEALTTKLCELTAGSALPRTNAQSGYSITEIELFGPNTFEVYLNAFSAQCGGVSTGYISVEPMESFDSTTWLVPIIGVLHP